jgi:hypothetical protein
MDQKQLLKEFIKLFNNSKDKDNNNLIINKLMKENYENEDYWKFLLESMQFEEDFIKSNYNDINIEYLIKYQVLSENVLLWMDKNDNEKNSKYNNLLIKYQILPESLLLKYIENTPIEKIDFYNLALNQNLTDDIIEKYEKHFDWDIISQEQLLKLQTIVKYNKKINWSLLPFNMKTQYLFNDTFILIFQKENIWDNIGWMDKVTIECLWGFKNLITNKGWLSIIEHKQLSNDNIEDFINNIMPQLNINELEFWDIISANQKLSEEFIEKYQDKINWESISLFQELSWTILQKFSKKIILKNLSNNDCLNDELIKLIKNNNELFLDELIL